MVQHKDRIRVHIAGQEFYIVGGEFQEMLAAVKQINGRRFVSELKVWQLPGTVENIERQLDISGYQLESGRPIAAGELPSRPAAPVQAAGDRIRILVEGRWLAVTGGEFQEMLAMVKNLPGRRFNLEAKVWEIPGEVAVVKGMIESAGFQLEGAENISIGPVPPMESLDFLGAAPDMPPPFEEPDFFEEEDVPEVPDWWGDDTSPPPVYDPGDAPESFPFSEEYSHFEPAPPRSAPSSTPAGRGGGNDRIRIRLGQTPMIITGGSFQEMLNVVKSIPGRRFNNVEKVWEFPDEVGLETVQQAIHLAGFEVRPE